MSMGVRAPGSRAGDVPKIGIPTGGAEVPMRLIMRARGIVVCGYIGSVCGANYKVTKVFHFCWRTHIDK